MPRAVAEWVGKTPDTKAPARVRDRVFERAGRVCHLCRLPIKVPAESWQLDHIVALVNGGANAESNLAPAHAHCHIAKTAVDVAEKAKVAKIRQKHTGARRPDGKIRSAGFPKADRGERAPKQSLPPRQIYAVDLWQPLSGDDHD